METDPQVVRQHHRRGRRDRDHVFHDRRLGHGRVLGGCDVGGCCRYDVSRSEYGSQPRNMSGELALLLVLIAFVLGVICNEVGIIP
jgi:hypothetical protein